MGLDMYVFISKEKPATETPDCLPEDAIRIHYWRKQWNLHRWMEQLYREKGGAGEFNMTPLVLTEEDLNRLEAAIKDPALPEASESFFGHSDRTEVQDYFGFMREARLAQEWGYTVLYTSWW